MPKFYLYARKSTDEEDRQVLSIESQLNDLRQFAIRENLNIIDELTESRTAKEPGRPIFTFLLDQLEKGNADGILAWHPDRLARNSVDGGRVIYLVDVGKIVDLRFPTYRFDNTAQGKFMLSIMFGQSKYYVDNLSENVKRGIRCKLRRGEWPGWAPLGYTNDYRQRNIVPDPEKAPFIRKIFTIYSTGDYSLEEIMNEVRLWSLEGRAGKPIRKSTVYHVLKNPFYYGMMRLKGELYEASHPPLIAKELFDKCQAVMKQRAKPMKRGKIKWAFAGFMKCGECGASVTAEIKRGHKYYRCTKKIVRCSQRYIREEALLEQIKETILKIYVPQEGKDIVYTKLCEFAAMESKASSPVSVQIEAKLREYDAKIERLTDLFVAHEITKEEYQAKKAKLLNEKQDAKDILDKSRTISGGWLEQAKQLLTTCHSAGSVARQGNPSVQKGFLKIFGSNFILKNASLLFTIRKPFNLVEKRASCPMWLPGLDSNQRPIG